MQSLTPLLFNVDAAIDAVFERSSLALGECTEFSQHGAVLPLNARLPV